MLSIINHHKMQIKPGDMTTNLLECQNIKIHVYIYIPAMSSVGRDVEELALLNIASGSKKWYSNSEKHLALA